MHILSLGDAWSSIRRKEAGDHSSIHSQEGPETYSEDGKETNPQNTLVSEWELLFIRSNVQCTRSHKHTFYSLLQNQQYHLPHRPLLQPPLPYLAEFAPQSTGQLPVTLSTSRSFWSLFSKCNMCVAYRRISRCGDKMGLWHSMAKSLSPLLGQKAFGGGRLSSERWNQMGWEVEVVLQGVYSSFCGKETAPLVTSHGHFLSQQEILLSHSSFYHVAVFPPPSAPQNSF